MRKRATDIDISNLHPCTCLNPFTRTDDKSYSTYCHILDISSPWHHIVAFTPLSFPRWLTFGSFVSIFAHACDTQCGIERPLKFVPFLNAVLFVVLY